MSAFVKMNYFVPDKYESGKLRCKHCPREISGSLTVTSNFISHMKKMHRDEFLKTKTPKRSNTTEDASQGKMTNFTTGTSKYKSSDPRQIRITEALMNFVAGDLLPLSIVDSPNFREFMELACPQYQVPCRKVLTTKILHERATEVKQNIIKQLKSAESVYLTMDLWSNRLMKSYIGITGHYILDYTMRSVMLACSRFKGKHSSERIRQEFEEVLSCYDIGHKVLAVVTDNASNMVKCFNIPGFVDTTEEEDDTASDGEDDCNADECSSDELPDGIVPRHARCYAHTLQLCMKDGFKECGSHIRNIIGKASSIVAHVRKSIHATEFLENEKRLQTANVTRWNSQLAMIRSVLSIGEEKLNIIDHAVKLSTYERKVLQEVCDVLEPFEDATLMVQRQKCISGSLVIPITIGLQRNLDQMTVEYALKMLTELKRTVRVRLAPVLEDEMYILASILDPRIKNRWCEDTKCDGCFAMLRSKTVYSDKASTDETDSPPNKKVKLDLLGFMKTESPRKRHQSSDKRKKPNELDIYITEDCLEMNENPIEYWEKNIKIYPKLAQQAFKHLPLPASSAAVERLFSVAGKTFRPERCRLSDTIFEALMMVKANNHM